MNLIYIVNHLNNDYHNQPRNYVFSFLSNHNSYNKYSIQIINLKTLGIVIGIVVGNVSNAPTISWSEVFTSMQQGACDGVENAITELNSIRSEEPTSELQSHSESSYAVFCWKKKNHHESSSNPS